MGWNDFDARSWQLTVPAFSKDSYFVRRTSRPRRSSLQPVQPER
jgi:hypothetical protein